MRRQDGRERLGSKKHIPYDCFGNTKHAGRAVFRRPHNCRPRSIDIPPETGADADWRINDKDGSASANGQCEEVRRQSTLLYRILRRRQRRAKADLDGARPNQCAVAQCCERTFSAGAERSCVDDGDVTPFWRHIRFRPSDVRPIVEARPCAAEAYFRNRATFQPACAPRH